MCKIKTLVQNLVAIISQKELFDYHLFTCSVRKMVLLCLMQNIGMCLLKCIMLLKQFYDIVAEKRCYYFWWSTWLIIAFPRIGCIKILKWTIDLIIALDEGGRSSATFPCNWNYSVLFWKFMVSIVQYLHTPACYGCVNRNRGWFYYPRIHCGCWLQAVYTWI